MNRISKYMALIFMLCIVVGADAAVTFEATGETTSVYADSFIIDDVTTGEPVPLHVRCDENTQWMDSTGGARSQNDLVVGQVVNITVETLPSQHMATVVVIP